MNNETFVQNALAWENEPFDTATQQATQKLKKENPEAFEDAFYKNLEFGTGGMRGVMGIGTNRVNRYTFGRNTQGIANYLKKQFPEETLKVVIAFDCRHQSDTLAKTVAAIFSANDIQVYLFSSLRPTPELSFAVKELNCQCGIVLTASHNPPEYNGYKVYWKDGGQIVPPQDAAIVNEIESADFNDILFTEKASKIEIIDKEVDDSFIDASIQNGRIATANRDDFKIVFTPLHGTSVTILPQVLEKSGYSQLQVVEEQATPDGDFPTVVSPNPEETEALTIAMGIAEKTNADMVIGTDPDADRLGIVVRNHDQQLVILNGNQAMMVMTHFLLEKHKQNNTLSKNAFVGSTVVSTPMIQRLAEAYGVECKLGLTGFKWIAKMIEDFPDQQFIGGGEESFGFMVGDFVRDKDAITSSLLACEIAAEAKTNGRTFFDTLIACYIKYGFYKERLISIVKKGKQGASEIQNIMKSLRSNPLTHIDESAVCRIEDYENSTLSLPLQGKKEELPFPKSNVLIYETEEGTRIAARPSGTEPKIKFYFSVNTKLDSADKFKETEAVLDQKIERIISEMDL
jgi:phosphoglucomutase